MSFSDEEIFEELATVTSLGRHGIQREWRGGERGRSTATRRWTPQMAENRRRKLAALRADPLRAAEYTAWRALEIQRQRAKHRGYKADAARWAAVQAQQKVYNARHAPKRQAQRRATTDRCAWCGWRLNHGKGCARPGRRVPHG